MSTGWEARCFHALFMYRLELSSLFLRLCSDMTCERMRFRVSSFFPSGTDCWSICTQNRGDLPLFGWRGLRTRDAALLPAALLAAPWGSGRGAGGGDQAASSSSAVEGFEGFESEGEAAPGARFGRTAINRPWAWADEGEESSLTSIASQSETVTNPMGDPFADSSLAMVKDEHGGSNGRRTAL